MSQQACRLEKEITKKVVLDYLLHVPEGYDQNSDHKWPVILFLHGSGERGSDVGLVKVHGVPHIVDHDPAFPFIAISPQCPEDSDWHAEKEAVMAVLDEVMEAYHTDPARVYLTGLSMGGYGTWLLAAEHPSRFAAAVPVCGGGNPKKADTLKETPIWAFHGAKDDIVPLSQSEVMVEAVQAAGGDVKLTVYPEANHNSWSETYDNQEVYNWLLKHTL
ncbi:prolyl oligopeptidase family serine peptidase [Paenibacillus sp. KQZ6P-2]|uniref:Prolyl oligopeptidase family serine peptidase n=1 Tax=Paenibacillus mangrovi TaxID=2931978 RepID=A0A9X1WT10_9BACL|nr:prolyl oligopeptidase family serine peptidase [Paenibacillus mangrovi]MCJ8014544.1 prolyl oligopeptidase family serine peptidase [Paenibacillus mangrovi]